jgi:serine/threonine-protein kinase
MEQETDLGYRHAGRALALDALGRRSEADRELAVTEQMFAGEKSFWIALVYAARNDPDRAFTWLDRALRQHDDGLLWMTGDPLLSNVASDPRYKAFLGKMNLPE